MYQQTCRRNSHSAFADLLFIASATLLAILALTWVAAATQNQDAATVGRATSAAAKLHVIDLYAKRPMSFERNDGQTDAEVKFISRGDGYTLFLTPTEAVLALRKPPEQSGGAKRSPSPLTKAPADSANNLAPRVAASAVRAKPFDSKPEKAETQVLRVRLVGANPHAEIDGVDRMAGKSNYFIGNDPKKWHTAVPNYAKVELKGVYPGIDLVYYGGNQTQLEYDFRVASGADPNAIRLRFKGENKLALDDRGDLIVRVGGQKLIEHAPTIYQESGGKRQTITGGWKLRGAHAVGFKVASYDRSRPIVIDPVLLYSTYFGGSGNALTTGLGDYGYGIAVDSAGYAYVTGIAHSPDFPTLHAFQSTLGTTNSSNEGAVFVAKFNPAASGAASLLYSTYLGGTGTDYGTAIAVDSSGNAYVTGVVGSFDFPTLNAFQTTLNGETDAFVAKLNPSASGAASLLYSTYLGGVDEDSGAGIAVDSSGNAYVTGLTRSTNSFCTGAGVPAACCTGSGTGSCTFPTLNAFQSERLGVYAVFVAKLNPAASGAASLLYSTYLSGGCEERGEGIAVDSSGKAYVTGFTCSTDNSICTGPNFPELCCSGSGTGTCVGFPVTGNAYQGTPKGTSNAFVAKLNPAASGMASLLYSTYLGGSSVSGGAFGQGVAVDSFGKAYVTGYTDYTDFPTLNAFQSALAGNLNVFVSKLDPAASGAASLLYSTYLGGTGSDTSAGIAVDSSGKVYVTGETFSIDNSSCTGSLTPADCCTGSGTGTCVGFPTVNAFQGTNNAGVNGGSNAFVTELDPAVSGAASLRYSTYLGGSHAATCSKNTGCNGDRGFGIAVDSSGNAYVTGLTLSTDFPTVDAFQSANNAAPDLAENAFVAKVGLAPSQTATATPTVTPTPATPTATATGTATATSTSTSSRTATPTPTATSTSSRTATPTATGTATPNQTPTATPTPESGKLTFKPDSLNFGDQTVVGKVSKAKKITIKNDSSKKSKLDVLITGETTAAPFAVKSECSKTLAPGKSCKVSVTFSPTDTTAQTGSLTMNDDEAGPPQEIPLSGTGKEPKVKK